MGFPLPPSLVKTTIVVHLVHSLNVVLRTAYTLTALRNSPDLASTTGDTTNPLDEQQQQFVASKERAKRRSEIMARLVDQRDYVFRAPSDKERLKEAGGRSLSGWFIEPETTSPSEIAARTTLRERHLQPCVMS